MRVENEGSTLRQRSAFHAYEFSNAKLRSESLGSLRILRKRLLFAANLSWRSKPIGRCFA